VIAEDLLPQVADPIVAEVVAAGLKDLLEVVEEEINIPFYIK